MKEIPKIGRGRNMSIAKAGLIVFFEDKDFQEIYGEFDVGIPDPLHKIIDIAGAKHCSFFTPAQVIACLRSSLYFDSRIVVGMYSGIRGQWRTSLLKPSKKGIEYYNKKLKR